MSKGIAHIKWCFAIFIAFLAVCFAGNASAQKELKFHLSGDTAICHVCNVNTHKYQTYQSDLNSEIYKILNCLYCKGYIAATVDSVVGDSLKSIVYVNTAKMYHRFRLSFSPVALQMSSEYIYKRTFKQKNDYYNPNSLAELIEGVLKYAENNGYPFAQVYIDSVRIEENIPYGRLTVDKGRLFNIDSVAIKGNLKLRKSVLLEALGIKEGDVYNESSIKEIQGILNVLSFCQPSKPSEIQFFHDYTKLVIFADARKSSSFDGIVGFMPDKDGKLSFTGNAKLFLVNAFRYGEELSINWSKLLGKTVDLKTNLLVPYMFATPFGIEAALNIYRKDTSYLDVAKQFGVAYFLRSTNYIKLYVDSRSSSLLSVGGVNMQKGLQFVDNNFLSYGLALKYKKLDDLIVPRNGSIINLAGDIGERNIIKNTLLPDSVYKGLEPTVNRYAFSVNCEYYKSLSKRFVLFNALRMQGLFVSQYFENELFRIGGLKTLRGFDEESIRASFYSVFTVEARLMLERRTYISVFTDMGYRENKAESFIGKRYDTPYGFGAGLTFDTKAGLFSINYALGSQGGNPILFRSAKVHFGIVAKF